MTVCHSGEVMEAAAAAGAEDSGCAQSVSFVRSLAQHELQAATTNIELRTREGARVWSDERC